MPICIECGEAILETTKIENGVRVLRQCPNCLQLCDTFAEMDVVQKSIAISLLHTNAYRHVLFNIPNLVKPLALLVVLSCLVESYVGLVQISYFGFYKDQMQHLKRGAAGHPQSMPTLQYTAKVLLSQAVAQSATKYSDHAADSASPHIASLAEGAQYHSSTDSYNKHFAGSDEDAYSADETNHHQANGGLEAGTSSAAPPSATANLYSLFGFLSKGPSLRLVNVVDVHQELHIVPFYSQLPLLFLYEIGEFIFLLLVVVWIGSSLISKNNFPSIAKSITPPVPSPSGSTSSQESATAKQSAPLSPEIYRVLLRALALSSCTKLGYILFLIWDMPLYLVVLVEGYQFLILLTAIKGSKASFKAAFFVTLMCLGARYIFRKLLRTLPPFLASVALQLMIMRR